MFGAGSRAALAQGLLQLLLHIQGALSVQEAPEGRVTQTFLMDMDCNEPNIPAHEILSIFRAEQQLISQSSAPAPPISAGFQLSPSHFYL